MMRRRTWVRSGISEELDARQERFLNLVLVQIIKYYRDLYQTRPCYSDALSLARLSRLCRRNSLAVTLAVKTLANSVEDGERTPFIWYERVPSQRHPAKRYYRITLR